MTDLTEKAREIAHAYQPRCTGGEGTGFGGDAPRYHSNSCNSLTDAISQALAAERAKWMLAQKALNQIDDGFEYRYGDEKSRAFVHKALADYTAAIRRAMR